MMCNTNAFRSLLAGSALLLVVAPAVQAADQLPDAPSIDARAFILMDYASGKVLTEGNADEKLDPASLTKIMTSYVVGQALKAGKIKLPDMVTIGRDAWATGNPALRGSSVMFLKPGEEYAVHKEKEFTFNNIRQPNRNRLLWSSNLNVDGVKTGTTAGAGYNLVSSATQGDMRLIAVVLGTKSDRVRFNESEKLLTWGFRFYETVTPIKPDATFISQRVWYGDSSEAKLGAGEAGSVTIPRGQLKNLKASYTLTQPQLTAPLTKGQVVGTIDFKLNDKTIEQRPLIVMEAVEEGGFFSRMMDFVLMKFHEWFGGWFS